MKKRRGVAARVTATLVLALGGFALAAVVSPLEPALLSAKKT
jgi:hypothetical protein